MKRPSGHQDKRSAAPESKGARVGVASRRRCWFRLAALLAVPLLVVGVEWALRLAGYGYPSGFFLTTQRDGKAVVIPNDRFGQRFFPASVARSPTPWVMDRVKAAGTCRVFLFGESAALGDPRPAFGMGRYLQVLLQERHPGVNFEVVTLAMTAINSHAVREMALEARRYEGDLWVVYMGNNEMVGPFGALSMYGARAPSRAWIRTLLAVKSTRLGQALANMADAWHGAGAAASTWKGLGMFGDRSLAPDDPARARVEAHFRENLRDIVVAGAGRGIPIVLATVASNLRDCAPFASQRGAGLSATNVARWDSLLAAGIADQAAGRHAEALMKFGEARRLDDRHAGLRYREGRSALLLTNLAMGLEHLAAARDFDALPVRAGTALNRIVVAVAADFRDRGVSLVDVEQGLEAAGPPGQEVFLDHVHLNFEGNYRVARQLAEAIEGRLPDRFRLGTAADWATQERADQRLALTDWNRVAAYESMLQRCQEAPFTNQLNHVEHMAALGRRFLEIRERLHPRMYFDAGEIYREAIARAPNDPHLYEVQAEFLEAIKQPAEALAAWRRVSELLPHHPAAWYHLGRLLSRQGDLPEARAALERCLSIRSDVVEASLELGQMSYRQTNYAGALAVFDGLRRRFPEDPRVLRYRADPLAALGRRPEALDSLRQAVQLRPSYWEARYLLGVELALDDKILEAGKEFEAVLRLRPDHVLARLNLGVALVRLGQVDMARRHFAEVLRQEPQNARARQHLETIERLSQAATNGPAAAPKSQ